MESANGLLCRHTELEDLLELEKLREKIKYVVLSCTAFFCASHRASTLCFVEGKCQVEGTCSSQEGTTGVSSDTKLSSIIAFSTLCLTAVNPSTNTVVGTLALAPCQIVHHILPTTEADSELHKWICDLTSSHAAGSPTGLVIPIYVLDPNHEEAALTAILRYAFELSPSLISVILLSESTVPLSQPFLLSYFTDTGSRGPGGEVAYSSTRESFCPALTVRPAVVEDTDDLVPIVEGSADLFGSLAKVRPCRITGSSESTIHECLLRWRASVQL
jgi:hypothetical protein